MDDLGVELLSPRFPADPHSVFARMRAVSTVLYSSALQAWILTGYDACRQALRSSDIDVGRDRYLQQVAANLGPGRAFDYIAHRLSSYEEPDHSRLRSVVQGAFTAHRVQGLRRYIGAAARDLVVTAAAGEDPVDFLGAVAHPLPSLVISELLGIPPENRSAFDTWTGALAPLIGPAPTPEQVSAGRAAAEAEWAHLSTWLAGRSTETDDLTSVLLQAHRTGWISEDEVIATIMFLFSAGHQTTRDLLGNGLHALFQHPDQWQLLRERPELAGAAVTEMLRYDSSVTVTIRGVRTATDIDGARLPAGAGVVVALAGANRDPARFPEPDRFDLERPDPRPLSFGGGAHHCVGAALARMEAEIVLRELVTSHPDLSPAYETLDYRRGLAFRGPRRLPVTFSAARLNA